MAQVDRATREDVEHLLARASAAWESLPDVQRDFVQWDLVDQLAFIEEWPLEEERLERLATLARVDIFSDSQRARYARLLRVVADTRPIVERLRCA